MMLIIASIIIVILIPYNDKYISDYMRESRLHNNTLINVVMRIGNLWGLSVIFLSILLFIVLKNKTLGLNTLKATVISVTIARCLSTLFGRARPFASRENASNFNILKGLKYSLSSMPSGHSTVAFAFAAAADRSTPQSTVKTVVLYGLASITALSRVYHDRHWLSDVIMGGTLGYLVGSNI
jgi:membrane-associated phospholipid phosphatase